MRGYVPALTTSLLTLGIALNVTIQLPQVMRTVVRRSTSGLSLLGMRAGVTGNLLWLCYGFAAHDPAQILCNTITSTFGLSVLIAHRRHSGVRIPLSLDAGALLVVAVWVAGALTHRASLLAATGACYGLLIGLPQLLTLIRTSKPAGVARGTYVVAACSCAVWSAYWLRVGKPLCAGSAVYSGLVALAGLTVLVHGPRLRRKVAMVRRELSLIA